MRFQLFLLGLTAILFSNTISAQESEEVTTTSSYDQPGYRTALGVRLSSSPADVGVAITAKQFLNETAAIEVLFAFGDPTAFGLLYEKHQPFSVSGLQWFYGGGGYVGFEKEDVPGEDKTRTNVLVGAQGVVGLDYKFTNLPLNLSLDWKPELRIIDNISFEPAAVGVSVRFTFN